MRWAGISLTPCRYRWGRRMDDDLSGRLVSLESRADAANARVVVAPDPAYVGLGEIAAGWNGLSEQHQRNLLAYFRVCLGGDNADRQKSKSHNA